MRRWLPVPLTGMCQATTFCWVRIRFHLKNCNTEWCVSWSKWSYESRLRYWWELLCCTSHGRWLCAVNIVCTWAEESCSDLPLVSSGNRRNVTYWNGSATMCSVCHCKQCNDIECWTYIFYGLFMSLSIILTCFGLYLIIYRVYLFIYLYFYLLSFIIYLFIYLIYLFIFILVYLLIFIIYLFVYLYFICLFVYLS
jgi:hypothetical protein